MKQSEIYFLDEENNVTEKEKAVKAVIREFDKDGKTINETWLILDQ